MVAEIVGEPVQVILSINAKHSDEVGRVDVVSEELDAHAWSQVWSLKVDRLGDRHTNVTTVSAFEHTCVGVLTGALPDNLASHTLSVDSLVAASVPVALELITFRVEDGFLVDDESSLQVPAA